MLVAAFAAIGCSSLLGLDEFGDQPNGDASVGGVSGGGTGGDSGGDSGGSAGMDAAGDSDAPDAQQGFLGRECSADDGCGGDLTCWRAAPIDGVGPAKGYCTTTCDKCVAAGGVDCGITRADTCLQGCTPGPADLVDWKSDKCHARHDVACDPTGACVPLCNSHDACASGLFCNLQTGLCQANAPDDSGNPIGAECNNHGFPDVCTVLCHEFDTSPLCTALCTLGVHEACGWDGMEPADVACRLALDASAGGFGDMGLCVQLCDCDTDCHSQANSCQPDPEVYGKYSRKGFCSRKGAGISCP
jgi:hypothetical protein